jgi:hypothetical protein
MRCLLVVLCSLSVRDLIQAPSAIGQQRDSAEDPEKVGDDCTVTRLPRIARAIEPHGLLVPLRPSVLRTLFVSGSDTARRVPRRAEVWEVAFTPHGVLGASMPRAIDGRTPAALRGLEGFGTAGMLACDIH